VDTFDLQQVGDVFMGESKLDQMDRIFIDPGVEFSDAYYREVLLAQKLLLCVRSVASSLSSSKRMLLLTKHARQSTFCNERHLHSFHQSFGPQQPRSESS